VDESLILFISVCLSDLAFPSAAVPPNPYPASGASNPMTTHLSLGNPSEMKSVSNLVWGMNLLRRGLSIESSLVGGHTPLTS